MPEPRSFVTPLFTSALSLSLVFTIGCTSPVVSPSALSLAQQRLAREVGTVPKKGTLVVVDYTKPSSEKRMTVIDLKTGRARMNSLVAHGVNSGLVYAQSFSDEVGSEKSSLGLYRVGEEYMGKHGPSLRLDGLDRGFNLNARKRGIVVHSASYVSKETMHENRHEYGRIGRSQGCLALNEKDLVKLDRKMQRPAYVFAYAPTLLAQGAYPPLNPAPPQPVLAQADNPAPTRKPTTPVVASVPAPVQTAPAPAPAVVDLPAIPRPTQVETGPVVLGDAPAQTGFYTVSGRAPVQ